MVFSITTTSVPLLVVVVHTISEIPICISSVVGFFDGVGEAVSESGESSEKIGFVATSPFDGRRVPSTFRGTS